MSIFCKVNLHVWKSDDCNICSKCGKVRTDGHIWDGYKCTKCAKTIPEMVFVEGGTFMMGSNDVHNNEKPIHCVTIDSFLIGRYPITQREWKIVMEKNPSSVKGNDLPVEQVSWLDVQEFITKLNQLTGKNYRLATEAEWEYAAKGGNKSRCYSDYKKPNELGIYGMGGDLYEWCQDWYDENYYSVSPNINPKGPLNGDFKVLRGGSKSESFDYSFRVAIRDSDRTDYYDYYISARLALDI